MPKFSTAQHGTRAGYRAHQNGTDLFEMPPCSPCRRANTAGSRQYAKETRAAIQEAKNVPCTDCGMWYPYFVMDFDHRDPATKSFNISRRASTGIGAATLQAEIDKCDVVCSNCHRMRTWGYLDA